MSGLGNERWYPAKPDDVFSALQASLSAVRGRVRQTDAYARVLTFTTPASGFSWGATMTAQVVPEKKGAVVRVTGAKKMWANVTAGATENKKTLALLDAVSATLQQWDREESDSTEP